MGRRRDARRAALCALCFSVFSLLSAQSRDIPIFVPEPTGGTDEQKQYFLDNFKMELEGAKYPVVESLEESQYSLPLDIADNPYSGQAGEEKFILTIVLVRTNDNSEVVRFEFPFTDLQTMYDWNLFLVYRTMGNAVAYYEYEAEAVPPVTEPVTDRWRNKWLYAAGALGADAGYFIANIENGLDKGIIMPTASVGVEIQFLNFMSFQLDARLHLLANESNLVFSPMLATLLKGIWKPGEAFMIEPYAGATGAMGIGGTVPWLSGIGGVQLGFRCGARSAITLDISASMGILGSISANGNSYNLARITIAAGYKCGWIDRKKKS